MLTSNSNSVITTKFCTWHDSSAVVPCAELCSDLIAKNGEYSQRNSPSNMNYMGKKDYEMDPKAICMKVLLCNRGRYFCTDFL